jgi:death-on-curing protein
MALHYLTVQDILWINLQLTRKVQHFSYARLEEATFYQYAYGESNSLLPQAARFITGFSRMHPMDAGNDATGFVAAVAFLELNGREVEICDDAALAWFRRLQSRETDAAAALEETTKETDTHHVVQADVRAHIMAVINRYAMTITSLHPAAAASA